MDSWCACPSSTIARDTHSAKVQVESVRKVTNLQYAPTSDPPQIRASAPERTWATPQPDMRLCDRSHAHSSRPRTASNFPSHQSVTGRRPTGLTVTFSRPFDGPLERRPSPRGDGKSRLSLNRRELVQSFVSLAHKRALELRYLTHIANVHV